MNILFADPGFNEDEATDFMTLMATRLAERGHQVRGIQYQGMETTSFPVEKLDCPDVRIPWWAGRLLLYEIWYRRFRSYLSDHSPDVIVASRVLVAPSVRAAGSTPILGFFGGLGFTRFNPYNFDRDKTPSFRRLPGNAKFQYPFVKRLHTENSRYLPRTDEIVVISDFLWEVIYDTFRVDSSIVRTPVCLKEYRAEDRSPRYLTIINPRTKLKGADIFLDIATRLDDQEFLVAGEFGDETIRRSAENLENVTCLGWVDDMKRVYEQTKLVIVPSRYEEGGGPRTVIEGFVNGIPAVGTRRGAIPEHINGGGETVSDPDDIDAWIRTIRRVLNEYEAYAENARKETKKYAHEPRVDEFETLLEGYV